MLKQRRLLHILEHPTYRAKEARQRGHGALERQEFGGFQQLQALGRAAEQQWPATRSARAIRRFSIMLCAGAAPRRRATRKSRGALAPATRRVHR